MYWLPQSRPILFSSSTSVPAKALSAGWNLVSTSYINDMDSPTIAHGIDSLTQEIYLLHRGFATGKEAPLASVAKRFGLSETETAAILSSTTAAASLG